MHKSLVLLAMAATLACAGRREAQSPVARATAPNDTFPERAPAEPPARWRALIGAYGGDSVPRLVLERGGRLHLLSDRKAPAEPMAEMSDGVFTLRDGTRLVFSRDAQGRATSVLVGYARVARRQLGPESGNQLVVPPRRPLDELRREALAASPPAEVGPFRASDLVELTALDPTIKLEIRYATTNNFLGAPVYSQARAFLQRPAAEAVVRVHRALKARGYGLLVHDGYRPWYVTRMFWDAMPDEHRWLVADPSRGSRHNRGAAVDLTLYHLATGEAAEMPGTYDEVSERSSPDFPGGTSRQRWHRELLRRAMLAEGFTPNDGEWWHFDHKDWRAYGLGNVPFEQLGGGK